MAEEEECSTLWVKTVRVSSRLDSSAGLVLSWGPTLEMGLSRLSVLDTDFLSYLIHAAPAAGPFPFQLCQRALHKAHFSVAHFSDMD